MINVRLTIAALAAIFSLGIAEICSAVEMPTLYTAEVFLDEEAEDPREDAYRAALVAVLARVSGTGILDDEETLDAVFPVPSAYVTQFQPGEEEDSLLVSFDGEALERVLRNNGFMVWGKERPATLVWLAVDWGGGEREIIAAEDPDTIEQESRTIDRNRLLRERLLEIAERRGLPIMFPLLDTTDLQSVTFSDIWGGFDERIIEASRRYDVTSVLIGRVRPASSERNRWNYYFGDDRRTWSGAPEAVVDQIADLLATEFAVGGNDPLETVVLQVAGVETVDAYGSVEQLLSGVALIEAYRITEVAGDTVSYEVEIRGGPGRLRRALSFAGLIEQEPNIGFELPANELSFFYNP